MSRSKDFTEFRFRTAAASAATDTQYLPISDYVGTSVLAEPARAFLASGFSWMWEGSEGNADNTIDFVIDYTTDGTNYTTIHTNANTIGLLDTSAAQVVNTMIGDAAIAAAAGVAIVRLSGSASAALPNVRVPGDAVLRYRMTTAGTGTVPAIQFVLFGHNV